MGFARLFQPMYAEANMGHPSTSRLISTAACSLGPERGAGKPFARVTKSLNRRRKLVNKFVISTGAWRSGEICGSLFRYES
jgi:hypothetical protein